MARGRPRARGGKAPRLPLDGYRVVELAHHLAGPLAGMHLADFGADVVKVETLEGEDWRRWGRPSKAGMSQLFLATNRNKRSLSLDLGAPRGREVLERLLTRSDVLLTNWGPEALRALRLDPRGLARRHPRLVPCLLSAFGTRGPDRQRRAFDINVGGETGLLLPHPDGTSPPQVNTAPLADTGSALMLAYGVTLALLQRERTGRAQPVETALINACLALQAHRFIWVEGEEAPPTTVPFMMLYGAYATADGFITVAALAERLWRRLAGALDLKALLDDPRYTPWTDLIANQLELRPVLEEKFRSRTSDEWLRTLEAAGVPAGRVQYGPPVFEHPQLNATGAVMTVSHPEAGRMRTMGFPLRVGGKPTRLQRHAPALGRDTRAILRELRYSPREIGALLAARTVRA